jgi:hypothetical protein
MFRLSEMSLPSDLFMALVISFFIYDIMLSTTFN